MNTSCKINLFIIGPSVVANNSGDIKLGVIDVIKAFVEIIGPVNMSHKTASACILSLLQCFV